MNRIQDLQAILNRIDGRGYKAYRDIRGTYRVDTVEIAIDHVQGDPFAAPSRVRVVVDRSAYELPKLTNNVRRAALEDYLARRFANQVRQLAPKRAGSGKSGQISIDSGRQTILERTACRIRDKVIEFRISVGLPARGRTVLGTIAYRMLTEDLPSLARRAMTLDDLDDAERFINVVENDIALRSQLRANGIVAFVADGSVLPRESGISDRPMTRSAIPFRSPASLQVELDRPYGGSISGLGIPEGVTVIVGGGFHGKSTLLEAISQSVYANVPGDGRECVITRDDAVKIRAEDGRSVVGNDLRGFLGMLPQERGTEWFTNENASGSTSQAANILEAFEAGSRLLLLDEDTCATNFMVRDNAMRKLVPDEYEPITPFIDRVRQLYEEHGVSTILVMGGSGDYFSVADTVIWMNEYEPHDVTDQAKAIAGDIRPRSDQEWPTVARRIPRPSSIDPRRRDRTRVRARGTEEVDFGSEQIDLRQVEQIVDPSQTRGIAHVLAYATQHGIVDGQRTIAEILEAIDQIVYERGIDTFSSFDGHPGDFARPRRFEIAAAINRLRSLRVDAAKVVARR